jgi:hypothetical protein
MRWNIIGADVRAAEAREDRRQRAARDAHDDALRRLFIGPHLIYRLSEGFGHRHHDQARLDAAVTGLVAEAVAALPGRQDWLRIQEQSVFEPILAARRLPTGFTATAYCEPNPAHPTLVGPDTPPPPVEFNFYPVQDCALRPPCDMPVVGVEVWCQSSEHVRGVWLEEIPEAEGPPIYPIDPPLLRFDGAPEVGWDEGDVKIFGRWGDGDRPEDTYLQVDCMGDMVISNGFAKWHFYVHPEVYRHLLDWVHLSLQPRGAEIDPHLTTAETVPLPEEEAADRDDDWVIPWRQWRRDVQLRHWTSEAEHE